MIKAFFQSEGKMKFVRLALQRFVRAPRISGRTVFSIEADSSDTPEYFHGASRTALRTSAFVTGQKGKPARKR